MFLNAFRGQGRRIAAGVTAVGATAAFMGGSVLASADVLHPSEYAWYHTNPLHTFDHKSLRRGFQVYKEVCSACHSLNYICFRNLVGVTHTEAEAKEIAQEYECEDGPDDEGNMYMRPCKLADRFPDPYANEEKARVANNGALPPDLSLIVKARHTTQYLTVGGEDYVFSLLTGFRDPPAGITLRGELHYNPFFQGSAIGMARPLYDEMIEYEDGTPATTSQMAKDVTTFLAWTSEPMHDERRRIGFKAMVFLSILFATTVYIKRLRWSVLKSRQIRYQPLRK